MLLSENIIASMNRNRKETGIYDEIRTLLTKAGKDVVDFSGIMSNLTYAKEIEYLKAKDQKMAYVIDRIGHIDREVDTDLFSAVIHMIVGQQISTKALETIWKRILDEYKVLTPENITASSIEEIKIFGYFFFTTTNIKLLKSGSALVMPFSIISRLFLANSSSRVLKDTILHDVPTTIISPDSCSLF